MIVREVGTLKFVKSESFKFPEALFNVLVKILDKDNTFLWSPDENTNEWIIRIYEKCKVEDLLI